MSNDKHSKDAPTSAFQFETLRNAVDEIVSLRKEIDYLDNKIKSATSCHPNAIQTLLHQAINRTHFNNT